MARGITGLISILMITAARVSAGEEPSEYEVKAAFLFNFSKFVEWPEGTFASAADRITICVLGQDPFGTLLDDAVRDKRVNGREIAVQKTASVSRVAGCHIVFIASSEQGRLDEILARLADHPLLTVTDSESGAERGAIIELTVDDKRVRFEVNLNAVRRARLKLSSQLLKVAVRLIGQRDQGP
jgi:hypothetical protein